MGGTNPALLKALGYGNCVLSLNVAFNAEVVADAAVLYRKDPDDLADKMQMLVDDPGLAQHYRDLAPHESRRLTSGRWSAMITSRCSRDWPTVITAGAPRPTDRGTFSSHSR